MKQFIVGLLIGAMFFSSDLDLPVVKPGPETATSPVPIPTVPVEPMPEDPVAPPVFFGEEIPLSEDSVVYVLDYSCSMSQPFERLDYRTTINRWEKVVQETIRSVTGLSEKIDFNLVVYGTNGGCGVAVWRSGLTQATDDNKSAALAWFSKYENIFYGGQTPTGPAVVTALKFDPGAVVLLTDGAPSRCGLKAGIVPWVSHRNLIRKENTTGVRIDVFIIGQPGQYEQEFGRGVASDSGGTYIELRGGV